MREGRWRVAWAAAVGAAFCVSGCAQKEVSHDELRAVVERDAVRFSNEALPEALLARIARARVVVFGEYHQNSDHYAFMSALVVALHKQGVRQLLLEFPHAWDWNLVAAVADGDDPGWTQKNPNIGGALVDAVCRFDRTLPPADRIRVRAIDANHPGYGGAGAFAESMRSLAQRLAGGGALSAPLSAYEAQSDEVRIQTLESLRDGMTRDRSRYTALWGETRVDWLLEAIEIELASIPIRARWGALDAPDGFAMDLREDVMKHLCDARLREVGGKTVVNVGATHAQKSYLAGTRQEWLADYLVHRSPAASGSTETVVVAPARGTAYVDGAVASIDVAASSPSNELLRVMDEVSDGRTAFLAVDDPIFERDQILLNLLDGVRVCAPKRHFDAYVLLPEAHLIQRSSVARAPAED